MGIRATVELVLDMESVSDTDSVLVATVVISQASQLNVFSESWPSLRRQTNIHLGAG